MKKTVVQLLSVCLCAFMSFGMFTGCQTENYDDPSTLYISVWEGGYGIQWLKDLGSAFEAKNSGVTVKFESTTLRDKAVVPLTNKSVYDIVIADSYMVAKYATAPQYSGYDSTFHDISDVFAYTPDGEEKPIVQKLSSSVQDWCEQEGKYYYIPVAASLWGLTYNVDILSANSLAVPRTTGEMTETFDALKSKGIKAHIFSGYTDYWQPIVNTWWAQYDGVEAFNCFFKGKTVDDEYLVDIFALPGRYEAAKCAQTYLEPGSGYFDTDAVGYQYMPAQLKYLQGEAAFMANGGWLENEMKDSFKNSTMAKVANMRIPIISAITDRFDAASDKSEGKLREIVEYVDGGKIGTKPAGVSDGDIAIVDEARALTYMTGAEMTAVIPSTTVKSELAKDFLKFMYSDEGARIVLKADAGMQIPISTDFSIDTELMNGLSDFSKSRMSMLAESELFFKSFKDPIVYSGGLTAYAIGRTFEKAFASPYANDRITADEYYEYDINYYTANNGARWSNLLRSVGLID